MERGFRLPDYERIYRLGAKYKFNKNHSAGFFYYNIRRSGNSEAEQEIKYGDIVIPVSGSVRAFLDFKFAFLKYEYSMVHKDNIEYGFSAGFSVIDYSTGAELNVNELVQNESSSSMIPVPVFGLFGNNTFINRLLLTYSFNMFSLDIGDIDAIIFEFLVMLDYYITKNIGVGAGFNILSIDTSVIQKNKEIKIDYVHRGTFLQLVVGF
ncbi:hypothetical protein ACFLS9_01890 [Bacteroidota bacterium]